MSSDTDCDAWVKRKIRDLVEARTVLMTYLHSKLAQGDLHACADACMDAREIQAQLELLKELRQCREVEP
jgi:hypothetical protein